jgi:hypothetical protein
MQYYRAFLEVGLSMGTLMMEITQSHREVVVDIGRDYLGDISVIRVRLVGVYICLMYQANMRRQNLWVQDSRLLN